MIPHAMHIVIFIVLLLSIMPMLHFLWGQFRIKSKENIAIKRMRRVMIATTGALMLMITYLMLLDLQAIILTNLFGRWTEELFLAIALLVLYANWYGFLEFRRFRLLANTKV